jgi:hypothetical protein
VHASHDEHLGSDDSIEDSVGKPSKEKTSSLAMDNREPTRTLTDLCNREIDRFQEFVTETATLRFVPDRLLPRPPRRRDGRSVTSPCALTHLSENLIIPRDPCGVARFDLIEPAVEFVKLGRDE